MSKRAEWSRASVKRFRPAMLGCDVIRRTWSWIRNIFFFTLMSYYNSSPPRVTAWVAYCWLPSTKFIFDAWCHLRIIVMYALFAASSKSLWPSNNKRISPDWGQVYLTPMMTREIPDGPAIVRLCWWGFSTTHFFLWPRTLADNFSWRLLGGNGPGVVRIEYRIFKYRWKSFSNDHVVTTTDSILGI